MIGRLDELKSYTTAHGESVNGFIGRVIAETMERDGGGMDPSVPQAVSLPSETKKTAQGAAERTGETVVDFIIRAVDTQAQRDKSSLRLGINPATGGKLEKEA